MSTVNSTAPSFTLKNTKKEDVSLPLLASIAGSIAPTRLPKCGVPLVVIPVKTFCFTAT